ncbi:MAG: primase-helicase zinc-binding domain-containing protein, partial [Paracoccaceae bacterium]
MSLSYNTYAPAIVQALDLKKATSDEYSGPCPNCGGKDRFRISNFHGNLKHHCRKDCDFIARNNQLIGRGLLPEWENRLQPYHVMKQLPLLAAELHGNDVIVPLFDVLTGEQLGQQKIKPNGKKLFSKGLKKAQAGAFIGEPTAMLYLCEGWATAVAVYLSTKQQTLFALDAKT